MKTLLRLLSVVLIFAGAFAVNAEMSSKERIAIVKALKLKGIVGENNKGLLEFKSTDRKAAAVVDEENASRLKAYKEIADKTGASLDAVGAQRAKQIAQEDPSGVWLQSSDGSWKKK